MPSFTTRIELHGNPAYDDYATLHAAMQHLGFSRAINGQDGKTYALPNAEYVCSGQVSAAHVLNLAQQAVASTGHASSILVTEATSWVWSGLQAVAHAR